MQYILLIGGFVLLIKGADLLVDGASSLAKRLKVSDLVVGLTVVAFGTSAPELSVNVLSAIKGTTDIAIGNILGSNIANVLLILGISSIIYPLFVSKGTVWKEIPLSLLAAILVAVLANDQIIDKQSYSVLSRIDGAILLLFFIVFLYYSFSIAKSIEGIDDYVTTRQKKVFHSIIFIVLGLIGLTLGGKWIVDAAVFIAQKLNISTKLIGLTVVAVGTSLPELATSVVAAIKKNPEIAIGNVVGSNIFNIFFILGITAIIKPVPFQGSFNFDIGIVVFASLLLFLFMFTWEKHKLDRPEGIIFVALYLLYVFYVIVRG
ncbi:MAG: sodium:proton exchanger [Omnitrophica WOR_2 bacterium GWF2_38_59]|nr:MAG: sodium:proton exchanger [Omnitrophica WOR_2 bacterium GWF2_38_59]OGX47252.1 MAG: sodium:proton exchanger [Omnitrophica WOR_2 bacterium RIFOXYA2_FULL_38_17]OGX51963.1 MAG: sodium:proton exchanger [Omnitrophica WOR_2 bacterium RIFOXYA12_FULL_38_10]HBG61769.1 sodium:proton exchanger [Candidatus Omnitrophota bacterium]